MRAHDNRITTKFDDQKTVSAILDLAESRGWQRVKLTGSNEFKREAWVQAQERGIETVGYKPKQTDIQEAARRKEAAQPTERQEATSKGNTEEEKIAKAESDGVAKKDTKMTDEELGQHLRETNPKLFAEILHEKNINVSPNAQPHKASEDKNIYAKHEHDNGPPKDAFFDKHDSEDIEHLRSNAVVRNDSQGHNQNAPQPHHERAV